MNAECFLLYSDGDLSYHQPIAGTKNSGWDNEQQALAKLTQVRVVKLNIFCRHALLPQPFFPPSSSEKKKLMLCRLGTCRRD